MKHIEVVFHFLRNQFQLKQVQVVDIKFAGRLADTQATRCCTLPTLRGPY